MPPPSRATYRFGSFELRAAEHVLTRAGDRVPLSPKAIDLLTLLVERAGRVVDKQELLDTLWPGTFVEEANLSVQVAAARKALGGGAGEFIETIARARISVRRPRRGSRGQSAATDQVAGAAVADRRRRHEERVPRLQPAGRHCRIARGEPGNLRCAWRRPERGPIGCRRDASVARSATSRVSRARS